MPDTNKKTLLVVDDEPIIQKFVSRILADEGYTIESAKDGAEALFLLGGKRFDLVLLDTNMPTMNGFQLLKIMKQNNIVTPVIVLSGDDREELEERGFTFEPGTLEYLQKPIQPSLLVPKIKKILEP